MALKAFVFMADVLVAILVSSLILLSINAVATTSFSDYSTYYLSKTTQDTLAVLDKTGVLTQALDHDLNDAAFIQQLNDSLTLTLPSNIGLNLTIYRYKCVISSKQCVGFTEEPSGRLNVFIKDSLKGDYVIVGKRVFIKRSNQLSKYKYGVAILEAWFA
ncbi:hypothetical protein HY993_04425 [Candidatus Micrarchaeota archaeon]|nr:hypothetical protein [Candidatus Micrarchaeota archaeon]